jgi:hypothetical protein
MKVIIKPLRGEEELLEYDSKNVTIKVLREDFEKRSGTIPESYRMIYKGKHLTDLEGTLESYGVIDGDKIHAVPRLRQSDKILCSFISYPCQLITMEPLYATETPLKYT